jgi:ABC-type uncharacterized transport system permease subunit
VPLTGLPGLYVATMRAAVQVQFQYRTANYAYMLGMVAEPVTVYPGWLRVGFTFLVPLAFAITVPASALTGRFSAGLLAGAAAFTATLVAGTRWAWRRGLRRYSGASA